MLLEKIPQAIQIKSNDNSIILYAYGVVRGGLLPRSQARA